MLLHCTLSSNIIVIRSKMNIFVRNYFCTNSPTHYPVGGGEAKMSTQSKYNNKSYGLVLPLIYLVLMSGVYVKTSVGYIRCYI